MKYTDSKTARAGGGRERRERLTDTAREHLKYALESEDRPTTRYHIRAALQALVIEGEGEPN